MGHLKITRSLKRKPEVDFRRQEMPPRIEMTS